MIIIKMNMRAANRLCLAFSKTGDIAIGNELKALEVIILTWFLVYGSVLYSIAFAKNLLTVSNPKMRKIIILILTIEIVLSISLATFFFTNPTNYKLHPIAFGVVIGYLVILFLLQTVIRWKLRKIGDGIAEDIDEDDDEDDTD
jgi:hypothetical protein